MISITITTNQHHSKAHMGRILLANKGVIYFMNKTIICPVDFSEASLNAIEYAAKLAQAMNGELKILNVQSLFSEMVLAGNSEGSTSRSVLTNNKLREISDETNKMFKISCTYDIEVTQASLHKTIAGKANENNLIVMGTNGIDDLYQYFFGTNIYNVIKKSKCPVLIVPEDVSYGAPAKIVFAWDYNSRNKFSFDKMEEFWNVFKPELVFLHASKHKTEISKDVFKALREEVIETIGNKSNVEFEQLYTDDIAESIDHYMNESKANMLVLTLYEHSLIRNIIGHPVMQTLSSIANYPVMVLHA